jgi:hypothetical protein
VGFLTFSINVTLDGCVDHQEGIADDETHAFSTRLMDEGGAMLWGRHLRDDGALLAGGRPRRREGAASDGRSGAAPCITGARAELNRGRYASINESD